MVIERIEVDPVDHPQVAAALARLGGSGAWERLADGHQLHDPLDLADVGLLVAVGILKKVDGRVELARTERWFADGRRMSDALQAQLRRAMQHARGGSGGWSAADEELVLRQGRGSAVAAGLMADTVFPLMPGVAESFDAGHGRFLDVGVGVAAISIAMCQRFPGMTAVGLDVLPEVVRLARDELAGAEQGEQIEIRQQSITELVDLDAFDLAWVAQPFIPRAALDTGLPRVLGALRPGGALVMPVMAVPEGRPTSNGPSWTTPRTSRVAGRSNLTRCSPNSTHSASSTRQHAASSTRWSSRLIGPDRRGSGETSDLSLPPGTRAVRTRRLQTKDSRESAMRGSPP